MPKSDLLLHSGQGTFHILRNGLFLSSTAVNMCTCVYVFSYMYLYIYIHILRVRANCFV